MLVVAAAKPQSVQILIESVRVTEVSSLRYLGVLDQKFSFSLHVRAISDRVKCKIGALHRLLDKWVPQTVYLRVLRQKLLPQLLMGLQCVLCVF